MEVDNSNYFIIDCSISKKYKLVKSPAAGVMEHSGLPAAFYFVCQIFYYRPRQRGLYPSLHRNWIFLYYTECIILSIPEVIKKSSSNFRLKARLKMSNLDELRHF